MCMAIMIFGVKIRATPNERVQGPHLSLFFLISYSDSGIQQKLVREVRYRRCLFATVERSYAAKNSILI